MRSKEIKRKDLVSGKSYGIVDRVSGALLSIGTVVADPLPSDRIIIELDPPSEPLPWDTENLRFLSKPDPTPEEIAEQKAFDDAVVQRESDIARVGELRKLVGPGKPGLTQNQRDELNVLSLQLTVT